MHEALGATAKMHCTSQASVPKWHRYHLTNRLPPLAEMSPDKAPLKLCSSHSPLHIFMLIRKLVYGEATRQTQSSSDLRESRTPNSKFPQPGMPSSLNFSKQPEALPWCLATGLLRCRSAAAETQETWIPGLLREPTGNHKLDTSGTGGPAMPSNILIAGNAARLR